MSMRLASAAEDAPSTAYMVVPPRASDLLRKTLREAYGAFESESCPFGDLLRDLDRIEIAPRHT